MSQRIPSLPLSDNFSPRHIGPSDDEIAAMLATLGVSSLDALMNEIVPETIRVQKPLSLKPALSEAETLARLREIANENQVFRAFMGQGYNPCITPGVILRNVLENPGWYTQYTPYQAEIAQGRLEALFNYQTLICELTGFEIANSSLLDEGTAAAEAMTMCLRVNRKNKSKRFYVSSSCHPQTIEVVCTRAKPLGIEVVTGALSDIDFEAGLAGVLVQYPTTEGYIEDYRALAQKVHEAGAMVVAAADLLSLVLLESPAQWGADIAIGTSQRFGVPLGFGGPHAGYMSTRESYKRQIPGRIVGESIDVNGNPALRLALQTREQHIRREKATSNICTAQVLLAVMASMYAVYHGPKGLKVIAGRVRDLTATLKVGLEELGYGVGDQAFFDTLTLHPGDGVAAKLRAAAEAASINLRYYTDGRVGVSLDEPTTEADLNKLFGVFALGRDMDFDAASLAAAGVDGLSDDLLRKDAILTQEIFSQYHSETEFLRYLNRLQSKDLSLTSSMIPLGSCTMKLNATTEMVGITWPEFCDIHPFAPAEQTAGYATLFSEIEDQLAEITGLPGVSLQPNAGSQGEYAGMLVIRAHHEACSEGHRDVCLIPSSAHGTNPASAIMAGMRVVVVKCDDQGNTDIDDLRAKAEQHRDNLAAIMVTYPSTHGVFETGIREICDIVHDNGGQVYLDGANMNAQVGLCRPGDYGADVVHLNLHKTFCIPHGGGGPGMGPIAVGEHLTKYLPGHPAMEVGEERIGPVSASPYGSPCILPISWAYIQMLSEEGLKRATQVAILNANYMAKLLEDHFDVLYRGNNGRCAHEFILDMRGFKADTDIEVVDIAKRLMDYGWHAPTISWPVAGTMMIEPTESESKAELDRFCDAFKSIHAEIQAIADGEMERSNNLLKNAPHTAKSMICGEWNHPYTREQAAYPGGWAAEHKFWPPVARIDDAHGDRNLVCACPPLSEYAE